MDTEWGRYNVSCFKRVEGENLEDTKGTLSIVKGYGKTLGQLHALLKQYPYAEKRRSDEELLTEIKIRHIEACLKIRDKLLKWRR